MAEACDGADTVSRPHDCFPYLKLPAEIRLLIHQQLFEIHSDGFVAPNIGSAILLSGLSGRTSDKIEVGGLDVALLRTCKAVYAEAVGVLYQRNTFSTNFDVVDSATVFSAPIPLPLPEVARFDLIVKFRTVLIALPPYKGYCESILRIAHCVKQMSALQELGIAVVEYRCLDGCRPCDTVRYRRIYSWSERLVLSLEELVRSVPDRCTVRVMGGEETGVECLPHLEVNTAAMVHIAGRRGMESLAAELARRKQKTGIASAVQPEIEEED